MLILTRCLGEQIRINDDIEVVILGVKNEQVRLGIQAPEHIAVHREEIYQKLKSEKAGDDNELS